MLIDALNAVAVGTAIFIYLYYSFIKKQNLNKRQYLFFGFSGLLFSITAAILTDMVISTANGSEQRFISKIVYYKFGLPGLIAQHLFVALFWVSLAYQIRFKSNSASLKRHIGDVIILGYFAIGLADALNDFISWIGLG